MKLLQDKEEASNILNIEKKELSLDGQDQTRRNNRAQDYNSKPDHSMTQDLHDKSLSEKRLNSHAEVSDYSVDILKIVKDVPDYSVDSLQIVKPRRASFNVSNNYTTPKESSNKLRCYTTICHNKKKLG